ncbi:hypothetical protein C8F01DRAFT_1370558 [Mycena amicta]|nr:hypothetical protein C8F01DRAFT_1370558 [Mycena amicta]
MSIFGDFVVPEHVPPARPLHAHSKPSQSALQGPSTALSEHLKTNWLDIAHSARSSCQDFHHEKLASSYETPPTCSLVLWPTPFAIPSTSLVALRRVQAARACWSACNFDVSAGIHPLLLCDVYDYRNTSYCSPPCVIQALHASNTAGLSYDIPRFPSYQPQVTQADLTTTSDEAGGPRDLTVKWSSSSYRARSDTTPSARTTRIPHRRSRTPTRAPTRMSTRHTLLRP